MIKKVIYFLIALNLVFILLSHIGILWSNLEDSFHLSLLFLMILAFFFLLRQKKNEMK